MLKAMCYNSDEARQRFPRLLQIVEMYPDTLEAFIKKVGFMLNQDVQLTHRKGRGL